MGYLRADNQRFDIEKAFQDAQRFGYDYVELWGARPHAYPYDLEICANRINELIKKIQHACNCIYTRIKRVSI